MTNSFWALFSDWVDPGTLPGAVTCALVLGLVAWLGAGGIWSVMQRWAARENRSADEIAHRLLSQLARVGVWLLAFVVYADLVPALKETIDPGTFPGAVFYGVVFGITAWLVGRSVRLTIHRVLEKETGTVNQTAVRFLGQLARLGVWLFAFVSYAHVIPSLQHLGTAWLASVGVVSVVVGLAAQSTLGNLISGVSLVLYRPFKIGDQVQVMVPGGLEVGLVESINLGYTVMRTGDERRVVIPNSVMASQTCINLSMSGQHAACVVNLVLDHDANIDSAREILLEIARQHPRAIGAPTCRMTDWTGAGVKVTLTAWAGNCLSVGEMKCDFLESAKKQFDRAGIKVHRDCP